MERTMVGRNNGEYDDGWKQWWMKRMVNGNDGWK